LEEPVLVPLVLVPLALAVHQVFQPLTLLAELAVWELDPAVLADQVAVAETTALELAVLADLMAIRVCQETGAVAVDQV
jgi:hypothetical protein